MIKKEIEQTSATVVYRAAVKTRSAAGCGGEGRERPGGCTEIDLTGVDMLLFPAEGKACHESAGRTPRDAESEQPLANTLR